MDKDRPIPIRPRTPGAEDALLTPQELAAAFQLDFSPQSAERRRGSKLAGALLVLLLLAGGAAALLYLRPDFREKTLSWSSRTWLSAKQYVESKMASKPPAKSSPAAPTTRPPSLAREGAPRPPQTRPDPVAIAPPRVAETQPLEVAEADRDRDEVEASATTVASSAPVNAPPTVIETPTPPRSQALADASDTATPDLEADMEQTAAATGPSPVPAMPQAGVIGRGESSATTASEQSSPPSVTRPTAPPPVAVTPRPNPAPPAGSAPPAPPAPAPSAAAIKAAETAKVYEEARRLLSKALDAEENQDYVEAVRCYEAIKRLPVDARAMGIDVRLQRARKLMQ